MLKKLAIIFLLPGLLYSDLKSTKGTIEFDVDNNDQNEMVLSENGLGIGIDSTQANLHVVGNVIISQSLSLGGLSANDNLNIHGTYGFGFSTLSENTVLNLEHSTIFLDASAGDFEVVLPDAATVSGREYRFKKRSSENEVRIYGGGNLDGKAGVVLGAGEVTLPSIQLMSDGDRWNIMNYKDIDGILDDNLIGWWNFNETSGTTSKNLASPIHNGTLQNGLSFSSNSVTGISGQALSFDGVDDYVEMGDLDVPDSGLLSISLWQRSDINQVGTGSLGYLIAKDRFHGTAPYNITMSTDRPRIVVDGTSFSHTSSTTDGDWHHVVMTINDDLISLYVDGALSGNMTVTPLINDENFTIGSSDDTPTYRPYVGEIDEVKVFDIELSLDQVQTIYSEYR